MVSGVFDRAIAIAGFDRDDTFELKKDRFNAPEATCAERRNGSFWLGSVFG